MKSSGVKIAMARNLDELAKRMAERLWANPPMAIAFAVLYVCMAVRSSKRPDVPGLHERRNSAWRGRGSFGKGPFGSQVKHR